MTTIILILTFVGTALVTYLIFSPSREEMLVRQRALEVRRLSMVRQANGTVVDEEMTLPFFYRVLMPLLIRGMDWVLKMAPHKVEEGIHAKLLQAGSSMTPSHFLGLQTIGAGGLVLFGLLVVMPNMGDKPLNGILALVALLVLGWRLPVFWLGKQVTTRKRLLDKALPDVLDLLSVSVEAGLGLDGAIQKVGEKFPEPTSGEFRELLKEIRLGTPRADALRNLAERTGLPDMRTFTAAVIQAEQLGVSIARVLKGQSETLRVKRKQKVEEKAMALPVKMLFPLILFIFPTIFIVVLGPVLINMLGSF